VSTKRERILARPNLKPVPLYVEEWEETVYIRRLSLDDQDALSQDGLSSADMTVSVLIAALVDDEGKPIFVAEDLEAIRAMPFVVVAKVFAKAANLNGLTTKELDEAMASFDHARTESGPSDSPSPSAAPEMNSETSQVPS
jgi:hypothetical protein